MNDGSAQEPRVVHSSSGRLRINLPDPDGIISRLIGQLPGVKSATSNTLTENILILFDPQQSNEQTLLDELRGLSATLPVVLPGPDVSRAIVLSPTEPGGYATGMSARLYKVLGWSSVGMAVVGAVTPGIPTVPFVILAGYCFIRSSPQAHEWLRRSEWFGPSLRDWEEHHAIKRSVKYAAVGLMAAGLGVATLIGFPPILLAVIAALEAIGLVVVLRLPVVESPSSTTPELVNR
jgi:uncharacterized protein